MQQTRPKLQLKPKMSLGAINMKDNSFNATMTQNNEQNIFGMASQTDSTAADSIFSSSLIGGFSFGKASLVDLVGHRTSIASKRQRRGTELLIREEVRESEGSFDRGSSLEEGRVNQINSVVPPLLQSQSSPKKCFSDVKYEEFNSSVEGELSRPMRCDSNRSGSGSGRLQPVRSFINPETEVDDGTSPFSRGEQAMDASEELKDDDEEDEQCNAEFTDEYL